MVGYRFLLLLKPEANRLGVNHAGLLQLVYDHLKFHSVEVLAQAKFSGHQLRDRRALDSLYCRLAVVAHLGERALTPFERATLLRKKPNICRSAADEARLEFGVSGEALCAEGDCGTVIKLGAGAYAADFVARKRIVLNHFFPEFRDRFYAADASVIALECQTATVGLHRLRHTLVGHIRPDRARQGSLRASVLSRARELKLEEVSVARNFFHISPGYLEATYQLAFLFPERGSLQDRLAADTVEQGAPRLPANLIPESLSILFAETEAMRRSEALQTLRKWANLFAE